MIKWIFRLVVLVVVLLIAGGVALLFSVDHIVKTVVESQGTQQLQVPTTLGGANLGLLGGTVSLDNLGIGSPPGFTAPQMFSVGKMSVDTGGVMRLRNEPIHVSSINIEQPQLVIEQHGTKLNFRELMDRLPKSPDTSGPAPAPGTPATASQPVKLIIDSLTISNAHVLLKSDIPGLSKETDITLPTLDIKNIGNADGADNGVAIKDVITTVISKMVAEASHSSGVPVEVQALLSGNLGDIQEKLTGAAQQQLGALKVPPAVNGLLGNILKNKPAK